MTSIADYFKNISGEPDTKRPQSTIPDDRASYETGGNCLSSASTSKTQNTSDEFVASKNRRKFHRRNCEWASYILNSQDLLSFSSSQQAIQAGYKPCRTCLNTRGTKKGKSSLSPSTQPKLI